MTKAMTVSSAVSFLEEAARYFENRPTHGEDKAHWSNVYNAENCRAIAQLIQQVDATFQEAKADYRGVMELIGTESIADVPDIIRQKDAEIERLRAKIESMPDLKYIPDGGFW